MDRTRSVSIVRLAVTLAGLAVLAFGVGAGVEVAGLGRATAFAGVVVLALAFVLVLLGDHVTAPPPGPPAPVPGPLVAPGRTPLALVRAPGEDRPPVAEREVWVLGVCGGAALALALGGVLCLVLPGDRAATAVLLAGVVGWTAVVTVWFRLRSRPPR